LTSLNTASCGLLYKLMFHCWQSYSLIHVFGFVLFLTFTVLLSVLKNEFVIGLGGDNDDCLATLLMLL
jgi:hypothetical protein